MASLCDTGRCPAPNTSACLAPVTVGCPTVDSMTTTVYWYSKTPSPINICKRSTASSAEISALAPLRHATCWWNQEDLNRHSGVISEEGTPQTTSTAEAPTIAGRWVVRTARR
ncbi:hypothetical protein MRX96_013634 [Rhipicephalus microplus]